MSDSLPNGYFPFFTPFRKATLLEILNLQLEVKVFFPHSYDFQEWKYMAENPDQTWKSRLYSWKELVQQHPEPGQLCIYPRVPSPVQCQSLPRQGTHVFLTDLEEWLKLDPAQSAIFRSGSEPNSQDKKQLFCYLKGLSKIPKWSYTEQVLISLLSCGPQTLDLIHGIVTARKKQLVVYPGYGALKGTGYPDIKLAIYSLLNQGEICFDKQDVRICKSQEKGK